MSAVHTSDDGRERILEEIRRTARENGGRPLGRDRFLSETGIRPGDWEGRYWARWGDALREAGFEANVLNAAIDEEVLLAKLAELTRKYGHMPAKGEIMLERRADPTVPWQSVLARRLGATAEERAAKLVDYCRRHPGLEDVAAIAIAAAARPRVPAAGTTSSLPEGTVYLFKSGRYFKIGRTNAAGRRERELAILMPDKGGIVHSITTDDPAGIEAYWHQRFSAKRKNGEWFDLDAGDLRAFKRRRFM